MPPRYTDLSDSLPATVPFVGPETQERNRGRNFTARIGANESVFGPSPKAISAMHEAAADVWMYADPENHDLRQALAAEHSISSNNIVVGEGIDGLLGLAVRLFVGEGDSVVTSLGAYPTFNYHVAGFGGTLHTVPYVDDHEDPNALLEAAAAHNAKLLYIANPDNPMGTAHSSDTIQNMIDRTPDDTVLCLDEAYVEFADTDITPPVDVTVPNVLRFRTFSKAQGMAGLRIGYAIAEETLATSFNKVRNHFGVNRIAQVGALAALHDRAHLESVRRKVIDGRGRIAEIAAANGLSTLPSQTNFVAIDCGSDGDFARQVLSALIDLDIFVRMPGVAPLDRCIRVSVGTETNLDAFADALPRALAAVRG